MGKHLDIFPMSLSMNRLLAPVLICAALVVASFYPKPPTVERIDVSSLSHRLRKAEIQLSLLSFSLDEVEERYYKDVFSIEVALERRAVDSRMAKRAAWAIVNEAEERNLSPNLIAAIMQVENPWLIQDTVSYAGAVGWMQVMPFHVEIDDSCGQDLTDGPTSVCYGTDIFRQYIGEALDEAIRVALLRYNGCVNTPGCERYADWVLRRVN